MMDYGFLLVRDTSDMDSDEHVSMLHTWILDDPINRDYLKKLFKPEYLTKCAAVIALNCEEPWKMMTDLEGWISVIMNILEEHMKELPLDKQDQLRQSGNTKLPYHSLKLFSDKYRQKI
jgi:hypothetical protein